jgi:hypothetical protein
MGHLVGSNIEMNFPDKRRIGTSSGDPFTHITTGLVLATANAAGTTTTLVCANATPASNTNMIRPGDTFRLYPATGPVKEEKVFRVTSLAVAASTTVTFSPAAAVATASGDFVKLVGTDAVEDESSLDNALSAVNGGNSYTPQRLNTMTQNDKIYAMRVELDKDSI